MKDFFTRMIGIWALLGGALLLLIVGATVINAAGFTANMVARMWDGNVPGLPGYEDGVTMLVGVAALAMFPYCQLHRGHATVEILMENAPAWANRVVSFLSVALTIGIALYMAWMLTIGVSEARADHTETAVLGWPVWIFMPSAVISCILWAIAAYTNLFEMEETGDGT